MARILYIAAKDLLQITRDRRVYMFLLVMPLGFTLLFGYIFGAFGSNEPDSASDPRLPVALVNQDDGSLSAELRSLLSTSQVIRIIVDDNRTLAEFEEALTAGDLAGIIVIPSGYSQSLLEGDLPRLTLLADTSTSAGTSVEGELLAAASRLVSAVRTAQIAQSTRGVDFEAALSEALLSWQEPSIRIMTTSGIVAEAEAPEQGMSMANTSPGFMLQFAIAGLLTTAQVIVEERKSRSLQRLLTTSTHRAHILLGHYLAIFVLIFAEIILMIVFGQFVLHVEYLRQPLATLLVAFSAALCISGMGLLIGTLAKNDEQAVMFAMIPMFILAGLGGAWVPLEITGATFRIIGHLSPVAWAMDGFKDVIVRGLGVESVLVPVAVLTGYAVLFFLLSVWRLQRSEER